MGKLIGVDLGTANTEICVKGSGIVLRAPSVVAVSENSGAVVAVGEEARRMIGKTPPSIRVERPLRNGAITDAEIASKMLREFFRQIEARTLFSRPDVFICTPCGITGVERNAVENVAYEAGARNVRLVEEPLASAIGAGIPIERTRGSMIVDIGGGTTEVAVLCGRGIASAPCTIRVAGDAMDEAVIRYMRYRRGVLIGELDAEELKIRIGSVHTSVRAKDPAEVYGRSLRTNMAAAVKATSEEIIPGLQYQAKQIISAILRALEDTPPELSSDIYENGIVLTGGSSLLGGLARLISENTGIRVYRTRAPLDTVCLGLSRILESENPTGRGRPAYPSENRGQASRPAGNDPKRPDFARPASGTYTGMPTRTPDSMQAGVPSGMPSRMTSAQKPDRRTPAGGGKDGRKR